MNKITVILPTFKEPEYLDLCIDSFYKTQFYENDIIVIIDGHYDLNKHVIDKYHKYPNFKYITLNTNQGLAFAQNIGVHYSKSEYVLIVNDDNVFCSNWDKILLNNYKELESNNNLFFIVPNQIEPHPSIFKSFIHHDFGIKHNQFDLNNFLDKEISLRKNTITEDGWTLPIFIKKVHYLQVGGWDTYYKSPHNVDLDFFYKLQLNNFSSFRTHYCNFYHFGGKATKSTDGSDSSQIKAHYSKLEYESAMEFFVKWGVKPIRTINNQIK